MRKRMRNTWRLIGLTAAVLMLSGWWFAAHAADRPQPPTSVQEEKGMTTGPGEVQERAVPRRALPGQGLSVSGCYCRGGTGGSSGITRLEDQRCYKRPDDTCSGDCELTSSQPST